MSRSIVGPVLDRSRAHAMYGSIGAAGGTGSGSSAPHRRGQKPKSPMSGRPKSVRRFIKFSRERRRPGTYPAGSYVTRRLRVSSRALASPLAARSLAAAGLRSAGRSSDRLRLRAGADGALVHLGRCSSRTCHAPFLRGGGAGAAAAGFGRLATYRRFRSDLRCNLVTPNEVEPAARCG